MPHSSKDIHQIIDHLAWLEPALRNIMIPAWQLIGGDLGLPMRENYFDVIQPLIEDCHEACFENKTQHAKNSLHKLEKHLLQELEKLGFSSDEALHFLQPPSAEDKQALTDSYQYWEHIGLNNHGLIDKEQAIKAVNQLYRAYGLPSPNQILFLEDDLARKQAKALYADSEKRPVSGDSQATSFLPDREEFFSIKMCRKYKDDLLPIALRLFKVMPQGGSPFFGMNNFGLQHYDNEVTERISDLLEKEDYALANYHDIGSRYYLNSLALYEFATRLDFPLPKRLIEDMEALKNCILTCGHIVMFKTFTLVIGKPRSRSFDNQERLHNGQGAALVLGKSLQYFYWHGKAINQKLIQKNRKVTLKEIYAQQDIEIRHLLIERMGVRQFVELSGAEPFIENDTGKLWRIPLPNGYYLQISECGKKFIPKRSQDENIDDGWQDIVWQAVAFVNRSGTPDGNTSPCFYNIPPDIDTVDQAIDWVLQHYIL